MSSLTKQQNNNIPKLRFHDFFNEWEEKDLGDVAKFWNGKAHEQNISENGKYIVVNSKFISQNGEVKKYSNKQMSPLKKDDIAIVMSDIPNGKAIGKCFLINKDNSFTLNQRIGGIKSKEIISPFLIRVLNRNKYFLKFDNGVSQTNLRRDEVLRCPVVFPSLPEQQKIADFFGVVDKWIDNLHSQKKSLESYKKGMMQKIFSAKGGQVPEIRFKDENGNDFPDLRKEKLSSFLIERNEKSPKSDQYPLMAFVAYKGVTPKGERYNREFLVTDTENKIYKRTEFGDFIYSSNNLETGSIGMNHFGSACISPVYSIFKVGQSCDFQFMSSFLVRNYFINKMIRYRQGVVYGQWKIRESDFLKIEEKIPSIKEQKKIAEYLSSIDNLIVLKQQQITQEEKWKKGLMQRLFV